MVKFKKSCFITIVLISLLFILSCVTATDTDDVGVMSISSENITIPCSDMLMVEESDDSNTVDESDLCNDLSNNRELLGIDNSKDILGNSYEFEGSTFEQLQTKINELNPGDVLYIGNKSLISTWELGDILI